MANNEPVTAETRQWLDEYQRRSFQLANLSPSSWGSYAYQHKRAADVLYEVIRKAEEKTAARDLARGPVDVAAGEPVMRYLEGEELEEYHDRMMLSDFLLLIGYALECLTKGHLLAILPGLLLDGEKLDKLVANHELTVLFHDCGIDTNEEEKDWLKYISRLVVWGKYPAPKALKDWPTPMNSGISITNPWVDGKLKSMIDGLYDKAGGLLSKDVEERGTAALQ